MTSSVEPVLALVQMAAIDPAVCQRTALVLAEAQDHYGGTFQASIGTLSTWVGLSPGQTRKHVHALVMMGVLKVLANGNGGSAKALPLYQFNVLRLRALAQQPGRTSDLFNAGPPPPRLRFFAEDAEDVRQQMAIELHGQPGNRSVQFFLDSPKGDIAYGWTPLQTVLRPAFAKGAWTGWLHPQAGAPTWALSVYTSPEAVEKLRQWVQSAALGRVESIEVA